VSWRIPCLLFLAACRPAATASDAAPFVVDTFATAETTPFQRPVDGVALPDGRLALADFQAEQVFLLGVDGALQQTFGTPGSGPGEFRAPRGVFLRGDTLAVLNGGNNRLENFIPGRGYIGSRPLPAGVQYREARLLPGDTAIVATGGGDSALAVQQDPWGKVIARYGRPPVPTTEVWDFGAIRQEILAGRIPDAMRNLATPIVDPAGDLWLVIHTEGRVERYGPRGDLRATLSLPDSEVAPIRAAFFAANAAEKRPGVLRSYFLAFSGVARDHALWLLLARPDSLPATLLWVDSTGAIAERQVVPGAEGARYLISAEGAGGFYAVHPTEGLVFRLRRR
jgi:hypothetical protein